MNKPTDEQKPCSEGDELNFLPEDAKMSIEDEWRELEKEYGDRLNPPTEEPGKPIPDFPDDIKEYLRKKLGLSPVPEGFVEQCHKGLNGGLKKGELFVLTSGINVGTSSLHKSDILGNLRLKQMLKNKE